MIREDIASKAALGPGEGFDSQLVEVSGTQHAGAATAVRHIMKQHRLPAEAIVSTEYAGRGDHGDPVFLVTWKTGS